MPLTLFSFESILFKCLPPQSLFSFKNDSLFFFFPVKIPKGDFIASESQFVSNKR